MQERYKGQNGIITIDEDAVEIIKTKLGFKIIKNYEDLIETHKIKLVEVKEIRVRKATTLVKGYILIISNSEVETSKSFFYERNHKHTIDIESKQKNKEALKFKETLEERLSV